VQWCNKIALNSTKIGRGCVFLQKEEKKEKACKSLSYRLLCGVRQKIRTSDLYHIKAERVDICYYIIITYGGVVNFLVAYALLF
jgi:hypothetical protein